MRINPYALPYVVVCKFNSRIYRSPFIRAHTHRQTFYTKPSYLMISLFLLPKMNLGIGVQRMFRLLFLLSCKAFFFGCCLCRCGWLCVLGLLETDAHIRITHTREMFFCCSLMLVDCLTPMPPDRIENNTTNTFIHTGTRVFFSVAASLRLQTRDTDIPNTYTLRA